MKLCAVVVLIAILAPRTVAAQSIRHSVARQAVLDAALAHTASQRSENLQKVRQLLADPAAARAVSGLADIRRVSERLAVLDDRTLARLAKESDAATQSSGGGPSKVIIIVVLTLIVLAIVAAALAPESS